MKEGSGSRNIYYLCRDYLGSITHITNGSGSVVQELSYDAWGQLRNPTNQTVYTPGSAPDLFLGRGYTGHEHLSMFGLVNMNARLYDPAVGRFLSPDTYVKGPYGDPNKYRHGILSTGIGPISFGYDSEKIRYFIQNMVVHNLTDSRYFAYVKGRKGQWYFQFGGW